MIGMLLAAARNFFIGAYHDLPNVLFMGSLILGGIVAYLPLVWVALGLVLNASVVGLLQTLLSLLTPQWSQVSLPAGMIACEILPRTRPIGTNDYLTAAPSHWLSAAIFFATFSIYNAVQVAIREPANNTEPSKADARRAVSLSAFVVGILFFILMLARGFSGCETWLGGILGVVIGGGLAVGWWHILDTCRLGIIPDILQLVGNSAPAPTGKQTAIVCR